MNNQKCGIDYLPNIAMKPIRKIEISKHRTNKKNKKESHHTDHHGEGQDECLCGGGGEQGSKAFSQNCKVHTLAKGKEILCFSEALRVR